MVGSGDENTGRPPLPLERPVSVKNKAGSPWAAGLLFLSAFSLALLGLNPSFYMDDSPEIITSSTTLGLVHPPGYPLYTLLGRLASLLPLGPPCARVNLLAALLGAATCCLLFLSLRRRFQLESVSAWAFALLWMAGVTAYPACLSAKNGIYQMTAALLLGIWVSLLRGRHRPAFFLIGLSLCNHWMSMVVYGMGMAYLLWTQFRERGIAPKDWVRGAVFLFLGLSPYLYLPLRSALGPLVNWGHPANLGDFLMDVSRHAYQGRDLSWDLSLWGKQALYYFRSAFLEFSGLSLLSALGFYALWRAQRRQAFSLLLSWAGLLAAVCVFSKYSSERPYLMENYSISSFVLLPLLAALGFQYLLTLRSTRHPRAVKAAPFAALALVCFLAFSRVAQNGQAFYTYSYDYVLNAWRSVPKGGLFFCKGDVLDFPSWYLQMIAGKRSDLAVLGGGSLPMDWYRAYLSKSQPELKVPFPGAREAGEVPEGHFIKWMTVQNPGRRLFFTYPDLAPDGLGGLATLPSGLTQEGFTAAPPLYNEDGAEKIWRQMRLRHFQGLDQSVDRVSWNYFLKDYGMARLWMAEHWIKIAQTLPAEQSRPYYLRSLPHYLWAQSWDPQNARYALDVGLVYSGLGKNGVAMDWFRKSSKIDPENADAYYYAGVMAYKEGDIALAKSFWGKTLELAPGHTLARQSIQNTEKISPPPSL